MKAIQDSRVHGVPRTSLYDRIKGRVIHGVKPGPKQYLTVEEETELAIEAAWTNKKTNNDNSRKHCESLKASCRRIELVQDGMTNL